jgi:hypothetical protein
MSFYTDVIQSDPRFRLTTRVSNTDLLEPVTREEVNAIVADAAAQGINLMIFETYRSAERQQLLFAQGATQLRQVGVHHYGLAADLVKNINGEPSWKGDFSFLAHLVRQHGLVSGLDWGNPNIHHTFVDSGHVQRITVGRQASLFSGIWYPDDQYDPYKDGAI